mmetsp:Transcript_21457/g.34047  ORF Transcript_21457/g.34047 Transcript_21457/m.34047 type:complete len:306 (-) Transcript_21457:1641-2558(-)
MAGESKKMPNAAQTCSAFSQRESGSNEHEKDPHTRALGPGEEMRTALMYEAFCKRGIHSSASTDGSRIRSLPTSDSKEGLVPRTPDRPERPCNRSAGGVGLCVVTAWSGAVSDPLRPCDYLHRAILDAQNLLDDSKARQAEQRVGQESRPVECDQWWQCWGGHRITAHDREDDTRAVADPSLNHLQVRHCQQPEVLCSREHVLAPAIWGNCVLELPVQCPPAHNWQANGVQEHLLKAQHVVEVDIQRSRDVVNTAAFVISPLIFFILILVLVVFHLLPLITVQCKIMIEIIVVFESQKDARESES